MPIGDGRDIHDHQPPHHLRMGQRQHHRGLAPHRMADQIDASAQIGDQFGQIARQRGIAGIGVMRAVAMVAQIDGDDAPGVGQPAGLGPQVAPLAVKAVDQKDGQAAFGPDDIVMQLHGDTLDRLACGCHPVYSAPHDPNAQQFRRYSRHGR